MTDTTNNPSPAADSSLPEPKFTKVFKHIVIDVSVLEELSLSQRSIYKVPCNLRKVNEEAYTPLLISIGPIHFSKVELMPMQEHKLRYFHFFWKSVSDEQAMEQYKNYLEQKEEEIRRCYAEKFPEISKDCMVEMMLLDAVFIMELLLRNCEWKSHIHKHEQYLPVTESFRGNHDDDLILTQCWLSRNITRDLILLENQIPFFVLDKLYEFVPFEKKKKEHSSFVDLAIEYFAFYDTQMSSSDETKRHYLCSAPCISKVPSDSNSGSSTEHLADPKINSSDESCSSKSASSMIPKHFTDLIRRFYLPTKDHKPHPTDHHALRTATKLRDSGVSFEKCDEKKPLLEITFEKTPILSLFLCLGCFPCLKPFKARLRIPQLKVNHTTECVFRNLIAFEQCHYQGKPYICNYVSLIDSLIHTKQDVDILVEKEVIVHELGSDEEVATLVNSLCKHVVTNSTCYNKTINDLNDHYLNQWNHTVGALRFVYFRDLWRASSTLVGIAVLIFTVFQFLRAVPVVLYHHV